MEQLSAGASVQALAYFLPLATAFFVLLALRERDVLLSMGVLVCAASDAAFAVHLRTQREGGANATLVTLFCCLSASSVYAFAHQLYFYAQQGCGSSETDSLEDVDDDEEGGGRRALASQVGAAAEARRRR